MSSDSSARVEVSICSSCSRRSSVDRERHPVFREADMLSWITALQSAASSSSPESSSVLANSCSVSVPSSPQIVSPHSLHFGLVHNASSISRNTEFSHSMGNLLLANFSRVCLIPLSDQISHPLHPAVFIEPSLLGLVVVFVHISRCRPLCRRGAPSPRDLQLPEAPVSLFVLCLLLAPSRSVLIVGVAPAHSSVSSIPSFS